MIGLTFEQEVNYYNFCLSSMVCCGLGAVIQDVENSSLETQYQSFASLLEQRLAELFVVAHRQGVRFKRATTVGSYTVQVSLNLKSNVIWRLLGMRCSYVMKALVPLLLNSLYTLHH